MTSAHPIPHHVTMIRDNLLALAALATLVLILVAIVVLGRRILQELEYIGTEVVRNSNHLVGVEESIDNLRLKSRTRIGQLATRTGMPDPGVALQRLGRTTATKRVVVGGEQGSAQREGLKRTVSKNRDEED